MVVEKVIMGARWLNGKWIKAATETVSNSAPNGSWINGKWVKETPRMFEEGKVYSKMKVTSTTSIPREVAHTRLPEGMLPEEMSSSDIGKLMSKRYHNNRYGKEYYCRGMSKIENDEFLNHEILKERSGISIDNEYDWVYRKPAYMTDRIKSFQVLPQARVSMNLNANPEAIEVLDRYISKGEIIVNGKLVRTVTPPKAYYKVAGDDNFFTRSDPYTMYFRENVTEQNLRDITQITEPFKCSKDVYEDKSFLSGQLTSAKWLSFSPEHSPEDLYKLYKRAKSISPTLGEGVTRAGIFANRVPGIVYPECSERIERLRFRISEGLYYAIESVINDYAKALGKRGFDRMI